MIGLQLAPVVLSLIVLAAHFFRSGNLLVVAVVFVLTGLLAVPRPWAARVVQAALLVGAAEWVRTLCLIVMWRVHEGEPVMRLILILGTVALLTALSALLFRTARMQQRYALGKVRDLQQT